MPLPEELKSNIKSKVADVANSGPRWGGMLNAGLFLQTFVGDHPWAHLDIAGPAFNEGSGHGYTPGGGTGVGVRTLLSFLEGRATAKSSRWSQRSRDELVRGPGFDKRVRVLATGGRTRQRLAYFGLRWALFQSRIRCG